MEIQNNFFKCKMKSNKEIFRLFDGILYCAECGHRISICKPKKDNNKTYTVCNTYRAHSKLNLCTTHSNNYDVLEAEILNQIRKILMPFLNKKKIREKITSILLKKDRKKELNTLLESLKNKVSLKQEQLDTLYIDKLESKITEEMYSRISKKFQIEINKLKIQVKEIMYELDNHKLNASNDFERLMNDFLSLRTINKPMIFKLINRIDIYQNKIVDIHFNFNIYKKR